jgi:hypothetical protein
MARDAEEASRRQETTEVHLALARWCYGILVAVSAERPSEDLMRAAVRGEDLDARVLVYAAPRVRESLVVLDSLPHRDLA